MLPYIVFTDPFEQMRHVTNLTVQQWWADIIAYRMEPSQ